MGECVIESHINRNIRDELKNANNEKIERGNKISISVINQT